MLSDDGAKIVQEILKELSLGLRVMPTDIGLKHLEEKTRIRSQNIGMAFDDHIKPALLAHGIAASKCGKPMRIKLSKA